MIYDTPLLFSLSLSLRRSNFLHLASFVCMYSSRKQWWLITLTARGSSPLRNNLIPVLFVSFSFSPWIKKIFPSFFYKHPFSFSSYRLEPVGNDMSQSNWTFRCHTQHILSISSYSCLKCACLTHASKSIPILDSIKIDRLDRKKK